MNVDDLAQRLTAAIGVDVGPLVAEGPAWAPLSELLEPGSPITGIVDRAGTAYRTDDRTVAATLAWKQVVYVWPALLIGPWALAGLTAEATIARMRFRLDASSIPVPALVDPPAPTLAGSAADVVAGRWVALIEPLVDRWRSEARVGRRGLWSLAATASAQLVTRCTPGDLATRHAAVDRWLTALPTEVAAMVPLAEIREPGSADWAPFPLRTACCLYYKVPPYGYCSNCNLLDDAARTERLEPYGYRWRPRG